VSNGSQSSELVSSTLDLTGVDRGKFPVTPRWPAIGQGRHFFYPEETDEAGSFTARVVRPECLPHSLARETEDTANPWPVRDPWTTVRSPLSVERAVTL
jgi:hypothetical protein